MKKCIMCGGRELTHATDFVDYSGVALVEADVITCKKCGERYEGFPALENLSKVIATTIARREERLQPAEVRFLRTYLGYSSKDLAAFLGVTPETVSRWESKTSPMEMQLATEKLLRLMALNDKPISDYGLDAAGVKDARPKATQPHFRQKGGSWQVQLA